MIPASDASVRWRREWKVLRQRHLPVTPRGSLWSFSRRPAAGDPSQGWKLHVSASLTSACAIFRRIAPYLSRQHVVFKATRSLEELSTLNAGIAYGFSQVGKFVTVYPRSTPEAVKFARALDRLTRGQAAPQVPYDRALRPGSCVYYRFGAFSSRLRARAGRKLVPALRRPDGSLVPDRRGPGAAVPPWLHDPFRRGRWSETRSTPTPLESNYRDYQALVQRGRGGVYRALDISTQPHRRCVIKEGRRHGESDWSGRDGYYRVQNEARLLKILQRTTQAVPRVRTTFRARGTFHLVTNYVRGRTLLAVLTSRERLSCLRILAYSREMSRIVAAIHAAGWVWRDCKPANFICGKSNRLVALDFEGSFRSKDPVPLQTGTPGYLPPPRARANPAADDLFALGVCIAQAVRRTARPPHLRRQPQRTGTWRRFPAELAELTWQLLDPDPKARPSAREAERRLRAMLTKGTPPAQAHPRRNPGR
jgi:hypothetical protein